MSEMPQFTDEQLAAAKAQAAAAAAAPVAAAPDPAALAAAAQSSASYEVDVPALLAAINAMQARLDSLEAERRTANMPPLVSTAQALRDLLDAHENTSGKTVPDDLYRLGDDVVEAAKGAVSSGDVTFVRDIAAKIVRALARIHPGGGDHPFYRQAVEYARDHLPEAADQVTAPQAVAAPAVASGGAPAQVVTGSLVG